MDPLQRSSLSHALVPSHEGLEADSPSAPARAQYERWLVQTAGRTEAGAAFERSISMALSEGGPGSRVTLEAKALLGHGLKLGGTGKVEVVQGEHGFRVVVAGGVAAKAGVHGHGWKAEAAQGLITGKAWHFETPEAAAWATSLLLQGLARDTPAELLLPADPALDARLQSLNAHASAAVLEWEGGAKLEGRIPGGTAGAEAYFTGAAKLELDRDSGELVMEQELKLGASTGFRALQMGDVGEAGPRLDLGTVNTHAAWIQRWRLTPDQQDAAGRGDLLGVARGLSTGDAHCEVKITMSGQLAGRGFEATALAAAQDPGEALSLTRPESLSRLPVQFAEVVPAHGTGAELELGVVELEVEAKVEPRRMHPGEARPLSEWLGQLDEGDREVTAGRLRQSLSALAHGQ